MNLCGDILINFKTNTYLLFIGIMLIISLNKFLLIVFSYFKKGRAIVVNEFKVVPKVWGGVN